MAISCNQVIVTTEATLIFGPDLDGAHVDVKVMGEDTVYIGGADVTSENGLEIENTDGILDIFAGPGELLYAICEEDTAKVAVLATLNQ